MLFTKGKTSSQSVKELLTTFLTRCGLAGCFVTIFCWRGAHNLAKHANKRLRAVKSRLLGYHRDVLIRVEKQVAGVFYAVFVDIIVECTFGFSVEERADVGAVGAGGGGYVRHFEVGVEEYLLLVEQCAYLFAHLRHFAFCYLHILQHIVACAVGELAQHRLVLVCVVGDEHPHH